MFKKLLVFLNEVKVELRDKTTWPSKDDVLNSTIVTVVSILIVSLVLYLIDLASSQVIHLVVIENISYLKGFVNEFTYMFFVIVFTLAVIFYSRLKSRLRR